jgi:exosome complex component RRP42
MEILNELKRDNLRNLLSQGKRLDERGFFEYRPVEVRKGVVPNAEGSALGRIGKTQVLCGVKFDIAKPFPDRPEEGVLSTGAELAPLASSEFEPGPPSDESIELARVVDRGIRSANIVDLSKFYIEPEKVLAIYVDLYVIDHGGNLIDTAALAAMAALNDARMPKIEEGKIIRGEYAGKLDVKSQVVACTFAKLDNSLLLDPLVDEERSMDARITFATTPEHVCAAQKGGWGAFTKKDIIELIDKSFEAGAKLRALV